MFKSTSFFQSKILQGLQQQLALQQELKTIVQMALPEMIASHCVHCVMKTKTLIIYTRTAGSASQLRFYQPAMRASLASAGFNEIERLLFRVAQPVAKPDEEPVQIPSQDIVDLLIQQGDANQEDELGRALLKLGKTLDRLLKTDNLS
jgi:hypothetical protein